MHVSFFPSFLSDHHVQTDKITRRGLSCLYTDAVYVNDMNNLPTLAGACQMCVAKQTHLCWLEKFKALKLIYTKELRRLH